MKNLNIIAHTILTKKNKYRLIISLCLLAIALSTGTSIANDYEDGCC